MAKELIPRPLPAKARLHLALEENANLRTRIAALEAQLAEARQAVALFENYGCPVCHGDCASANPPVNCCPMEAARRVREGGKVDG